MDSVYKEQLMDHYKNPRNKGVLKDEDVEVSGVNPFCGDKLSLQVKIDNNIIKDIAFNGSSCAVSTASASLATDWVRGKSITDVENMSQDDILGMLGVTLTTNRIKCATLILTILKKAVKKYRLENESEKNQNKVTESTNIAELIQKYPRVREVFLDYGLHCVGCVASSFDTIKVGAKVHGLGNEDIKELIDRINEVIKYGK